MASGQSQTKKARRPKSVAAQKKAFLTHFACHGIVGQAAKAAGVGYQQSWIWRRDDPDFKAAFEEAQLCALDKLEDAAWKRATQGVNKPVFQQRELVGFIREYSDVLTIFLLKGNKPEKYRERHEVSGPGGKPLEANINVGGLSDATAADLRKKVLGLK